MGDKASRARRQSPIKESTYVAANKAVGHVYVSVGLPEIRTQFAFDASGLSPGEQAPPDASVLFGFLLAFGIEGRARGLFGHHWVPLAGSVRRGLYHRAGGATRHAACEWVHRTILGDG